MPSSYETDLPRILVNPKAKQPNGPHPPSISESTEELVSRFHHKLPAYRPTPLHSLPRTAAALGLGHVLLKDESQRFGLPSFKILGASWAVYCAVAARACMPLSAAAGNQSDEPSLQPAIPSFADLAAAAHRAGSLSLVTCSEGNWGRAVAHMGTLLRLPVHVYVPETMVAATADKIRSEGPDIEIVYVSGNYDASLTAARAAAEQDASRLLVVDVGWEGFEQSAKWVVEGYSSMLLETQQQVPAQTGGRNATHAVVPVGVGSIAQAVTQFYKKPAAASHPTAVVAVEPTTAAGLLASLAAGKIMTVPTADSIMCGMNCGTPSSTAWPVLSRGVDVSVAVTDVEAHEAVVELETLGIHAGPCGAATLAALKVMCAVRKEELGLSTDSVVVLYCTEGSRSYKIPSS